MHGQVQASPSASSAVPGTTRYSGMAQDASQHFGGRKRGVSRDNGAPASPAACDDARRRFLQAFNFTPGQADGRPWDDQVFGDGKVRLPRKARRGGVSRDERRLKNLGTVESQVFHSGGKMSPSNSSKARRGGVSRRNGAPASPPLVGHTGKNKAQTTNRRQKTQAASAAWSTQTHQRGPSAPSSSQKHQRKRQRTPPKIGEPWSITVPGTLGRHTHLPMTRTTHGCKRFRTKKNCNAQFLEKQFAALERLDD